MKILTLLVRKIFRIDVQETFLETLKTDNKM